MKICRECGSAKSHAEFHRDRSRSDGYRIRCKPCMAIIKKAFYDANAEKIRAQKRAFNRENAERLNAASRARRAEDPEPYRARDRARRAASAEVFRERDRKRNQTPERQAWRRENYLATAEKCRARWRRYRERNILDVQNGKVRSRYGVSRQLVRHLWGQPCALCAAPANSGVRRHHIDHDHAVTGAAAIRGVLCCGCNVALGRMEAGRTYGVRTNDAGWRTAAQAYLARYEARLVDTSGLKPGRGVRDAE